MTDEELTEKLTAELRKSRGSLVKRLRDGTCPDLAEFVFRKTEFIDRLKPGEAGRYSWLYRIYCAVHGLTDFPVCGRPGCGNRIDKPSGFLGEKKGFRPYCCIGCSGRSPLTLAHRKETCLRECGETNKSKLQEVKDKLRATQVRNGSVAKTVEKSRLTRYAKNGGKWHAPDFREKV